LNDVNQYTTIRTDCVYTLLHNETKLFLHYTFIVVCTQIAKFSCNPCVHFTPVSVGSAWQSQNLHEKRRISR